MMAIQNERQRRKRNVKIGVLSFGVVIAFIGVWIPYMSNSLSGSAAATIFLIAAGTAIGGSVLAHGRYRKQIAHAEE